MTENQPPGRDAATDDTAEAEVEDGTTQLLVDARDTVADEATQSLDAPAGVLLQRGEIRARTPGARAPTPPTVPVVKPATSHSHGTQALSPLEALRLNEAARYRHLLPIALGGIVIALVTMVFFEADPDLKLTICCAILGLAVSVAWLWVVVSDPSRISGNQLLPPGLVTVAAMCTLVACFGVFSPAPILIIIQVFFVGLGHSTTHSLLVFLAMAGFQAMLSLLIVAGAVADPGFLSPEFGGPRNQLVALILIETVFVTSYIIARSSRRAMLRSFEKVEQAARAIAQRDAMVRELGQDFKHAMGLGNPGGLSGQKLGSFTLDVIIGRGGMGEVYKAIDHRTGELAAVKVLSSRLLAHGASAARFEREMEIASSLQVPNVVRVLEVSRGDIPYLAMEFLRGHDLSHHLRKHRRLPVSQVLDLVRQVGAGIDAAGDAGVVHRDLKPQNLFLAETLRAAPTWKILDFGVSTLVWHSGTLTQGHVVGTPTYMAPEQARGRKVDRRADVYSLTTIVYRALTGHQPFQGDDLPALLYDVVHEMPRQPSRIADVSPDIDAVLAIGMAKQPDLRFSRARELADALEAAGTDGLTDPLRNRAKRILAQHPWR